MIATLFLVLLIAFELWYLTSAKVKHRNSSALKRLMVKNRLLARLLAAVLMLTAVAFFIAKLGFGSGLAAALISLMAAGNLIVLLQPFNYIGAKGVAALYVLFILLEFII